MLSPRLFYFRNFQMYTVIIIIHVLVSIVLVGAVLLQAGKGASIGSTFGGASSQTLFGSAGPATLLAKVTGVCALIFMATSLYLTIHASRQSDKSIMSDAPAITQPAPAQGEAAVPAATPAAEPAPASEPSPAQAPAK